MLSQLIRQVLIAARITHLKLRQKTGFNFDVVAQVSGTSAEYRQVLLAEVW